jgi:hypothetical protein
MAQKQKKLIRCQFWPKKSSSCDWTMLHATLPNPKGQNGIPKVASRGRTWGSCPLCAKV